jgi:hypothetical protein
MVNCVVCRYFCQIYLVLIENQHCALGFVNVFITNAAPTCFGTYVPSSERLCPREYVKTKAAMYALW